MKQWRQRISSCLRRGCKCWSPTRAKCCDRAHGRERKAPARRPWQAWCMSSLYPPSKAHPQERVWCPREDNVSILYHSPGRTAHFIFTHLPPSITKPSRPSHAQWLYGRNRRSQVSMEPNFTNHQYTYIYMYEHRMIKFHSNPDLSKWHLGGIERKLICMMNPRRAGLFTSQINQYLRAPIRKHTFRPSSNLFCFSTQDNGNINLQQQHAISPPCHASPPGYFIHRSFTQRPRSIILILIWFMTPRASSTGK